MRIKVLAVGIGAYLYKLFFNRIGRIRWKRKLHQLFAEFTEEDIEMAEMGLAEYNEILLTEDEE